MKHKRGILSIVIASIMLVSLCAACASTSVSAAPSSGSNVSDGLVGAPAHFKRYKKRLSVQNSC